MRCVSGLCRTLSVLQDRELLLSQYTQTDPVAI